VNSPLRKGLGNLELALLDVVQVRRAKLVRVPEVSAARRAIPPPSDGRLARGAVGARAGRLTNCGRQKHPPPPVLRRGADEVAQARARCGCQIDTPDDPNLHSCGTVRPHGHRELGHPEQGLYTVGVKSYGRAPTFLMATEFEQVRSVVAAFAGDLEAADRVELVLPGNRRVQRQLRARARG
jgi:hypothetical protein